MNLLKTKQTKILISWFLAVVIGMIAGRCVSLGFYSERTLLMINLNWISAIGIFITLTQWLVLQHIAVTKWWVIAGFLGYLLAAVVSGIISEMVQGVSFANEVYRTAYNLFEGAIVGLCVGSIQWFGIRSAISSHRWWIVANVLGWSLGLMIYRLQPSMIEISYVPQNLIWILNILQAGIPIAGLTGILLIKVPSLVSSNVE